MYVGNHEIETCHILGRIRYKFGMAGGVQNLVFVSDTSSESNWNSLRIVS